MWLEIDRFSEASSRRRCHLVGWRGPNEINRLLSEREPTTSVRHVVRRPKRLRCSVNNRLCQESRQESRQEPPQEPRQEPRQEPPQEPRQEPRQEDRVKLMGVQREYRKGESMGKL